ncbi:MAG: hypothetical protein M3N18_07900 [Actinomycetota bacterium]|nr:hypothetical protein [Actinomycetota bacterium]
MRRLDPRAFPLVLFGGMLLLSLLGAAMGLASFLLLRAGYGFVVWGLPFLVLLLGAIALSAFLWWSAGGALPGIGRRGASEEGSPNGAQPRKGPGRGDDV